MWKEALTRLFRFALELLFPAAAADVDWSHPVEVLDKELRTMLRTRNRAQRGKGRSGRGRTRFVDHLVQVKLLTGELEPILMHLEVQSSRETGFDKRVYLYHSWLTGMHGELVATLVILSDPDPIWRPTHYRGTYTGGGAVTLEFPVAKILEFESRLDELLESDNPFALFKVACIKALRSSSESQERFDWKTQLTELLIDKPWDEATKVTLFQMLDAVMILPEARQRVFAARAAKLQEANEMKFITPTDQIALKDARLEGKIEGRIEGETKGWVRGQVESLRENLPLIAGGRLGPCLPEWVERVHRLESLEELTELRNRILLAESWAEIPSL